MSIEYAIPHKRTLKILCKSEHFPRRYKRKREWVFFSEHSVLGQLVAFWCMHFTDEQLCMCTLILPSGANLVYSVDIKG